MRFWFPYTCGFCAAGCYFGAIDPRVAVLIVIGVFAACVWFERWWHAATIRSAREQMDKAERMLGELRENIDGKQTDDAGGNQNPR